MGLTQKAMAEALTQAVSRNVALETYRSWERERTHPPADVAAFLEAIEQDDGSYAVADPPPARLGPEDSAPGDDGTRLALPPAPLFSSGVYSKICAEMFDMVATAVGMIGAVTGNDNLQADGLIIHGDKDELGAAWGKLAETNETFRKMLTASEKQGAYLAIALATGTTAGKIWRQHTVTNHDLDGADVLSMVRDLGTSDVPVA